MKLPLALIMLGIMSSGASAATAPPVSNHPSSLIPTLAMGGLPVPEPATVGLLGIGAASLILRRRRKSDD